MQLIGMLDSPYVRRVAISLELLGLPFEHRSISVFRQFGEFAAITPHRRHQLGNDLLQNAGVIGKFGGIEDGRRWRCRR